MTITMKTQSRIKVGDRVGWVTNYPGHEGKTVSGRVYYAGCSVYPSNLHVDSSFGSVELGRFQVLSVNGLSE